MTRCKFPRHSLLLFTFAELPNKRPNCYMTSLQKNPITTDRLCGGSGKVIS